MTELATQIEQAAAAQRMWMEWPATRRGETLARLAAELPVHPDTRADEWAGRADKINGEQLPGTLGELTYRTRQALGVVAVVVGRSDPGVLIDLAFATLACGNAAVLAVCAPLRPAAEALAEQAGRLGLPALIALTGATPDAGSAADLINHFGVAGLQVAATPADAHRFAALAGLRSARIDYGLPPAHIILADADVTSVVAEIESGAFIEPPRVLVERSARPIFSAEVELTEFDGDTELIALAADGGYGAAFSLWTRDLGRMFGLASRLNAGEIAVNRHVHGSAMDELIDSLTRRNRVSVRYR